MAIDQDLTARIVEHFEQPSWPEKPWLEAGLQNLKSLGTTKVAVDRVIHQWLSMSHDGESCLWLPGMSHSDKEWFIVCHHDDEDDVGDVGGGPPSQFSASKVRGGQWIIRQLSCCWLLTIVLSVDHWLPSWITIGSPINAHITWIYRCLTIGSPRVKHWSIIDWTLLTRDSTLNPGATRLGSLPPLQSLLSDRLA